MKKTFIAALVAGIGLLSSWAAAATDFAARVVTVQEGDRVQIYYAARMSSTSSPSGLFPGPANQMPYVRVAFHD